LNKKISSGLAASQALIVSLFRDDGTVAQRTARSGMWMLLSYGMSRFLAIVRSIILARLLLPADFGVVGMALVAASFISIWTEIGIAPALIHRQETDPDAYHTAWLISAGRGFLLCAVMYLSAGLIALFFKTPELAPIVRVMSITFIGYGLVSIGQVTLRRDLEFRKLAYVELGSEVLSLIAAVAAALALRSAWALVVAVLVKVFAALVGSYLVYPYRPRWRYVKKAANEIVGYGRYILGSSVVNYLLTQGDNLTVGRMLGATELGYYGMGYNLANLPSTSITGVIGQVAFPAYAKLQHDAQALLRAYLSILKVTAALAVPAMSGIVVLAPDLVRVLYGPKWIPAIVPLMIMCIAGLERSLTASVAPLLNAIGKPRIVFFLLVAKLLMFAAAIIPLTASYGITGTAIAGALVSIVLFTYTTPLIAKFLGCKPSVILRTLAGPFGASAVMVATLVLLKSSHLFTANLLYLAVMVIVGGCVYIVVLNLIDHLAIQEMRQLIRSQTSSTVIEQIPTE
jgi:lipopolysaccharide exporter